MKIFSATSNTFPWAIRAVGASLVLLCASAAHAGARDTFNTFSKGLKGLDGQFTQTVFDANGKRKESSSGRVALAAPRLFRWEYAKPYRQLIVADGKTVWVYEPDLQQVTKRAQGTAEQNSALSVLIDPSKLDKDYLIKESGASANLEWLELAPKQGDDAGFRSARLGFDKAGLRQMQIVDALGQRTEISFTGWKRNPKFANTTFKFTPPKGVDVVGEG